MLAPIQFLVFLVSLGLVVHYLITGEGYLAATISVWVKIALLWALTLTGMLWEHDVYGHYFMAREFFWEDLGNLVAIVTHNLYFLAAWLGAEHRTLMIVMLCAYLTYLLNAGQFIYRGVQSARFRRQQAQA